MTLGSNVEKQNNRFSFVVCWLLGVIRRLDLEVIKFWGWMTLDNQSVYSSTEEMEFLHKKYQKCAENRTFVKG